MPPRSPTCWSTAARRAARPITTSRAGAPNCCARRWTSLANTSRPIIAEAQGSLELLDTLIDKYRQQLLDSDFRAGCPVVAVSVEAGEGRERMAPVIERAAAAFDRWCDLIAQRFIADGIAPERANEMAMLATSALEGAILLARVRRDLTPLDRRASPAARPAPGCRLPKGGPAMTISTGSPPRASCANATAASSCRSKTARWPASAATRHIRRRRVTPATRRCGWTTTRTTAPG